MDHNHPLYINFDTEFRYEISQGNINKVKEYIENNGDVNRPFDYKNETALLITSSLGHFHIVELLVNHGANVNGCDNEGNSALMLAANGGYFNIVEYLILKGANVNSSDNKMETVLMKTVLAQIKGFTDNHAKILNFLLEKGARINDVDKYGWTALFSAVFKLSIQAVDCLLLGGADPTIKDNKGRTVLDYASGKNCDKPTLKIMQKLKQATVSTDSGTLSGFIDACFCGDEKTVKHQLMSGVMINEIVDNNNNLSTALIGACFGNHAHIVKILLEHGADVNLVDNMGLTAIRVACVSSDIEIFEQLLQKGVDVNFVNKYNLCALLDAILFDREKIITWLLNNGAKIPQEIF